MTGCVVVVVVAAVVVVVVAAAVVVGGGVVGVAVAVALSPMYRCDSTAKPSSHLCSQRP